MRFGFTLNKKAKIIIQIIVITLLLGGVIFYFTHQTIKEPSVTPELITIHFEPAPDLSPSIKEKYFQQFKRTNQYLRENPDDINGWLTLGSIMKGIKNYQEAEKIWLYTIEKWPDHPIAYANLGDLYWHFLKNYSKAEWAFQKAIEKSEHYPAQPFYYRNLFELYYYSLKNNQLAEKTLLEALEKYPEETDFLNLLGNFYKKTNQPEKAKEYFEKSLKIDPHQSEIKKELENLK